MNDFGSGQGGFWVYRDHGFLERYTNAITNPDSVRGCRQHAGLETISELTSGIIHQNGTLSRAIQATLGMMTMMML